MLKCGDCEITIERDEITNFDVIMLGVIVGMFEEDGS